jgi:tRNA A-37 threonylcarbamoyl transferase component Bud32
MATVVAATHLGLGRKVALKFMRPGVLDDAEATGRFLREARAAATLRSEHVAQVMDVEVDSDSGLPYIVMEYLEGRDLGSVLKTQGVPPVADTVDYLLQACEGLAEAHAKGIVHRDLKPANIFLTRGPDGAPLVKVLDFGISKLNEAAQSGIFQLTQPRSTIGSPQYMSPEQMIASPDVDARADIWALGVMLYELLAGRPPFVAATFVELCLEVTNTAHPPLQRRVPGLAPGLVAVVDRCLQKRPAARFANLAALAAALVPHGRPGGELCAARVAGTLGLGSGSRPLDPSDTARLPRFRGASRRAIGIGLTAGLLAGAAIVGSLLISRSRAVVPAAPGISTVGAPTAEPSGSAKAPAESPTPAPPPAAAAPTPEETPPAVAPPVAGKAPLVAQPTPTTRPSTTADRPDKTARKPSFTARQERRRPPASAAAPAPRPAEPLRAPPSPAAEQPAPAKDGATTTKRGPVLIDL